MERAEHQRQMTKCLRLLLLLITSAIWANTVPLRACSYERLSDDQLFANATAVFVARVVRTEEARGVSPLTGEPEPIVEATFRLAEILKGQPPPDTKVKSRVWGIGNCAVPLIAAQDYLIFLRGDSFVLLEGGSRPIMLHGVKSAIADTESLLQRLRKLSHAGK